jgi:U3 small nucleolar RNA-associated protein 7
MDALIARADAIRPLSELKKGKGRESSNANVPKSKGKAKAKESNDNDYTLQSISSRASIPKSLVKLPSSDPSSSKDASAAPKYTHIANKKLRDHLVHQHALSSTLSRTALDTQEGLLALAADDAGSIQLTDPLEKTWRLSQAQIQASVGGEAFQRSA